MTKRVGVGIIGFGAMAEGYHLQAIRNTRLAEVVAVYDVNERRRECAAQLGITAYDSVAEFLKDRNVTAVLIATPHNSHYPLAMKTLSAGKHLILEKPMTLNAGEAQKIVTTAKEQKCLLTVFHNRRFDGDFLTIKQILGSGKLGKIYTVQSRANQWGSGASFGTRDFFPAWRDTKAYGGGALLDWGVHLIDQMLQLPLGKPARVTASLKSGTFSQDCDDFALAHIEFDSGVLGIVEINFVTRYQLPRWLITAQKLSVIQEATGRNIRLIATEQNTERIISPAPGAWDKIYVSFFRKILGKEDKLAVEPDSVVQTMKLLDTIRKSARTGKTISLG
ncbi:MAG: Gfo/Idh/MocA family oxidoreductase [Candidatus Sumerlaeia bacterium]|nr:Gfo/Idh/MocA family oxidoreductase [Candidatus Sumerlaeia bacterium]